MKTTYPKVAGLGLLIVATSSLLAADPTTADKANQSAVELATLALQAEADGDFLARQRLQQEALRASANCPLVKTQHGQIHIGSGQWRSIDECIQLADQNKALSDYEQQRGSGQLDVAQHFALGRWCLNRNLGSQAVAHFNRVIQLEPDHSPARAALGYQRFGDNWISPDEIRLMQTRARSLQASVATYGNRLREIYEGLRSAHPRIRELTEQQFSDLSDPAALPAVEYVFSDAPDAIAMLVVQWFEKVDTIESSIALSRYALLHPATAIRSAATNALRNRPILDFAPQLVAMSVSPVQAMLMPVLNSDGTLAGYRQAFSQESAKENKLLVLDTTISRVRQYVDFTTSQNQDAENTMMIAAPSAQINQVNQAIERAVFRESREEAGLRQAAMQQNNAKIAERNMRIANLLSEVSGDEIAGNAHGVWQWWDQWNESNTQLSKERRFQRTMLSHSVPRYEGVREVAAPDYSGTTPLSEKERAEIAFQRRRWQTLRVSGSGAIPTLECLVAGTKVQTHRGKRAIESIRTGDLVLTRDIESGALVWKPVIRATTRPLEPIKQIETCEDQFRCTNGHLFWVSGKGWIKASALKPGDVLHGAHEPTVISRITDMPAQQTFNLIVADNANYFIGDELVLTHDLSERESTRIRVPGLQSLATKR